MLFNGLHFFKQMPPESAAIFANVPAKNDSAVMKTGNLFCVNDVKDSINNDYCTITFAKVTLFLPVQAVL